MTAVQLKLAHDIRELAAKLATDGWNRLQGVRLKFFASQIIEECRVTKWTEAVGRAAALCDLLNGVLHDEPDEAKFASTLYAATRLAGLLEAGQLADKIGNNILPSCPNDWLFVLVGNTSDGIAALANDLTSLGFIVIRTTTIDQTIEAWRTEQTIVIAAASWLVENTDRISVISLKSSDSLPASSLLVALNDKSDFSTQIKARQAGAQLLIDFPPDVTHLLTELAGLAWMPKAPYRVMIVDDNAAALDSHVKLLKAIGFNVLAINDPVVARDFLEEFAPEVCILDLEMPACRDTDLATLLHRNKRFAKLPVIYLSASWDIEHQLDARFAGGVDYLVKPVDPRLLITSVMSRARHFRILETTYNQRRQAWHELDSLKNAIDVHALVSVAASDGAIIEANQKFCDVSGYKREELIGHNHRIIKSGHHPNAFFEEMWRTVSSGHIWQGEVQNRKKDGSPYWVQSTIVPILDERGLPKKYVSIRTDVTQQKRLLAEQERRGRLLELLRQAFEHFIASHDIAATSELLLDGMLLLTGSSWGFLGEVQQKPDGTPYLNDHVISDIYWTKTSWRLYNENRAQNMEPRNLDNLIDAVLRTGETVINNAPLSTLVQSDLHEGHPQLNAFLGVPICDGETLIGMVGLANRPGGYDESMTGFLQTFKDSYVGILAAARGRHLQQHIIDELQQARDAADRANSAKSEFLASWEQQLRALLNTMISHAQILGMNDALDDATRQQVDEIIKNGTQLGLQIGKLLDHADTNVLPDALPASTLSICTEAKHKNGRQRILIAEDNPANQAVLRMQLDALGYQADIAADGSIALNKWQIGGHDLLLVDRNMPGMDGLELARAIRASEKETGAYVPMIAITADHRPEELTACMKAGMDDILPKPVGLDDLRRMLERWLTQASPASPRSNVRDATAKKTNATLDTSYLHRIIGAMDTKQTCEVIDLFTTTARGELPACHQHLNDRNGIELALIMHKLKSSARMVGALRFASLAETLEDSAKANHLAAAANLLVELEYELDDVEIAVSSLSVPQTPVIANTKTTLTAAEMLPNRVMVVDDDPIARRQVNMLLSSLGVDNVLTIDGGIAALAEISREGHCIDLVITDLKMPRMDGVEFLRQLSEAGYQNSLIIYSEVEEKLLGAAADFAQIKGLNLRGTIKKPMTQDMLKNLLTGSSEQPKKPPQEATIGISPSDIVEGLRLDQFTVDFQPKVDANTLRVLGVEALARWRHNGKSVPPDRFINTAEQCGLITALSEVLVTKAMIGGARLSDAGFPIEVAINLSMNWLADINLPEFIQSTIQSTGLKTENLILEITETGVMTDIATSMDVMTRLRLKGFKLSIDDFGTGYSSMDQLQRFPFCELKLDRSFVHDAAENPGRRAILASSVEMARKLSLVTVAEGVETQADLDLVRGFGCDQVQGWYIAKAMPIEEFIVWLKNRLSIRELQ